MRPYYTLSLGTAEHVLIGELEASMLQAIDRTGSFSGAARSLGFSYAFVWNSISRVERLLGARLVTAERGGYRGGKAGLTPLCRRILRMRTQLDSRISRLLTGSVPGGQVSHTLTKVPSLTFVGSHCVVVETVLRLLHDNEKELVYQMLNVGSLGGLTAMMLRQADIAGMHILDEGTQTYNLPLLSKYGLSGRCSLIRGYDREQCLMVRRGNPKGIQTLNDLLRSNVKLANRNPGSGTRILLDLKLRRLARIKGIEFEALTRRIRGYSMELMTHRQVADAVHSRRADVGVGLASVAIAKGLDALPFAEEKYDFVVEKRLKNPFVRQFISMLSNREFQRQIEATTPGISFNRSSGKLVPSLAG